MSFRENAAQQMNMSDPGVNMAKSVWDRLNNSWPGFFSEDVFPYIDENPYAVLYGPANSRPNTPVNVIIGLLVLKELFQCSDKEAVECLLFDYRWQFALRTSSYLNQPISDSTLRRFRARLLKYQEETGEDLLHNTLVDLFARMADRMNIDGHLIRMDSMMVESNIKKLGRLELIYTCVSNLVTRLYKNEVKDVIVGLERYYDPADYNRTIYREKSEGDTRLTVLLRDAKQLLENCRDDDRCTELEEYQLLIRCISEQTVENEDGSYRLRTKKDGGMDSSILQNPSDPDATYREKAGVQHRGYSANFTESVSDDDDETRSIITNYQYDKNTRSDSSFMKEAIENMPDPSESDDTQPTVIVTDGAYASEENTKMAEEKNATHIATDLTGRATADIHADFKFSEDGQTVESCPAGNTPDKCTCNSRTGQVNATFSSEMCANCPNNSKCNPKINEKKSTATVKTSKKSSDRAQAQRFHDSEEFSQYSHFRNGVETLPSLMRRRYNVDSMPVRGLRRTQLYFGFKVAALNCRKLFAYRSSLNCCAQK